MTLYAVFIWQILRGYRSKNDIEGKRYEAKHYLSVGIIAVLFACLFGFFLEWFQENYCKDRGFEWYDGIANTLGALLATVTFYFFQRKHGQ